MPHRSLASRRNDFRAVSRGGFAWLQANINAKKTAILIHGVTGGKDDMLPLAEQYITLGYAVYCPDLVGHGGSVMITLKQFDDLGCWFDQLIKTIGVSPDIIVSNSYSSGVVYNYMTQGLLPDKTHVILGCPTPTIARLSQALNRFGQVLPSQAAWYVYNTPPVRWARIKVLYRGQDQASYDWLVESEKRKYRYIAPRVSPALTGLLVRDNPFFGGAVPESVQCRVTVVFGERDNVITSGAREHLMKRLPKARFVSAGPVGHILHFEAIDSLIHRPESS